MSTAGLAAPRRSTALGYALLAPSLFGGPNLDILFVTSMAKPPLPRFPGDGVPRGSLFAIRDMGIRGLPEPRFAG